MYIITFLYTYIYYKYKNVCKYYYILYVQSVCALIAPIFLEDRIIPPHIEGIHLSCREKIFFTKVLPLQ